MPFQSLRSRLTIGVVTVLAVVLALGGTYVARHVDRSERQSIDDRLQRTVELTDDAALRAIEEESPPTDVRLNRVLEATGSSLLVTLGPTILFRAGVPLPDQAGAPLGFSTATIAGRPVRIYAKTLRADAIGGLARQQATTSLRPVEARHASLRRRLLTVGAAMLVLAGLGTWLAADLVLRPLRRLRAGTRSIEDEGDLERRVPEAGPRETRQLARSFNAMLERLGRSAAERHRALEATRRFAADAGHELRTPLTSVQAVLSTLQRHPDAPTATRAAVVDDALSEHRRLVDLLDGLQALARGDATAVEQDDVELGGVVAEAARALGERHPGVTVDARIPDAPIVVRGWEPGLRSLVDNLLTNATRHGRPGGRVVALLHPATATAGPCVVVEDDGPGIRPEDRERLFAPFARAADAASPGSGLGLAIVAQQAGHHGATVTIEDSALGGARFVVRFPRADCVRAD